MMNLLSKSWSMVLDWPHKPQPAACSSSKAKIGSWRSKTAKSGCGGPRLMEHQSLPVQRAEHVRRQTAEHGALVPVRDSHKSLSHCRAWWQIGCRSATNGRCLNFLGRVEAALIEEYIAKTNILGIHSATSTVSMGFMKPRIWSEHLQSNQWNDPQNFASFWRTTTE